MRSIRHRKLMEAAKRLTQGDSLKFQLKINEGSTCECELEIWKAENFREIEKGPAISELLLEFREWLEMPAEMMGKRSNEIALSKSRQYCLKAISAEDLEEFQRIFDEYTKFKHNQQSILVPIFGVVSVHSLSTGKSKWTDTFLLMPNLGEGNTVIFDIKGYCEGRLVEQRDYKDFKFGKDENFVRSEFLVLLENLPLETREDLFKTIEMNVMFLKETGVIDYSLLLAFRQKEGQGEKKFGRSAMVRINQKYQMGMYIIDFLQVYNQRKKLQNKLKSLFFKEISSVDPQTYAIRLIDFVKKALLIK